MKKKETAIKSRFSKLNALNFALAGGILAAICTAILSFAGTYGYFPFTNMILADLYSNLGYNFSWPNFLLATIYVFIEGFIFAYAFVWIYNKLPKNK